MKKILILAIACLMIFTAVGCSQQQKEVNIAITDIVEGIKGKIAEDMKAAGVSEDNFKEGKLPGYIETDLTTDDLQGQMNEIFNKEDIEEGIIIEQMMNVNSDLIIVLRAKDESKVDNLKLSLDKVREQQNTIWSTYLPDQYEKVKNNMTIVEGKYLIYITYEDTESIEAIFNNALNE
ncbi:DUF4358 domain-containing protein [Wukongibacter sp. M2B1]|uniref:DUF4358 domain-containing protein n=1 Tax=Wukongibacter sp. M2B1 TaxID=3088895 RepID=UPI003D7AB50B